MWVAVTGPKDWMPDPDYALEIGNEAYPVDANDGGGVASVEVVKPTIVRLRRLPDCAPIVRFVGQPGGRYVIRMSSAGSPRVEDWQGLGLDAGPALGQGQRICDPLPDTAIDGGTPANAPWRVVVAALSFLLGLIVIGRRLGHTTTS